jgi:murein DD-endopeptidase MepM/ murein hydrolase activator NlpD
MVDANETLTSSRRCAHCGGSTDLRTRHVVIDGNVVRAYCSAECLADAGTPTAPTPPPSLPPRGTPWWRYVARLGFTLPLVAFTSGNDHLALAPPSLPPSSASLTALHTAPPTAPEPPLFGPHWPPTDQDWIAEITSDAWIHPLDGPKRRMPVSDSRVFGAERPGERPGECRNGHCGVDLSGYWGEPVHAVHDGVVDRVQRGPNEEHGGLYVRIAHRDGSIFSQYFHLAAIPRAIQPGVAIKVGDLIGLVGDSGVKHSQPHLHFTLSVRPSLSMPDKYMDPEPLIALWPLRIPVDESSGVVTSHVAPGVPLGASTKHKKPHHHHGAAASASAAEASTDEGTASE